MPIEIQAKSSTGKPIWKIGAVSFDTGADANLISHEFVSTLGPQEVIPLDKEQGESARKTALGREWHPSGSVQLVWSITTSREVHSTRWLVVDDHEVPFDMVLGKVGIQEHRLDGRNGHRSWREKWSLRKRRDPNAKRSTEPREND
jgi:hypothetical protein